MRTGGNNRPGLWCAGAMALGVALLSGWPAWAASPVVYNGGFEDSFASGPPNWKVGYVLGGPSDFGVKGRTTAARNDGKYGGAFKPFHDAQMHAYLSQAITNLTPGASYLVRSWMKKPGGGDEGWYSKVHVYCETLGGFGSIRSAEATNVYQPYSVTNAADAQGRLEIRLHFDKNSATSGDKWFYIDAWYDGVSISLLSVPTNHPPVANPQTLALDEDTFLPIVLTGSDVDGDSLSYTIVNPPAHGSLSGSPPSLTYLPSTNYFGSDGFTFKANDGEADSQATTVSLTVRPINDAPLAQSQFLTLNEDTPAPVVLTAFDADGDALSYTVLILPAHGTLSGTAPNLVYSGAANYFGPDALTFKVNDGQVDSQVATVSLTIASVNDAPVAVAEVSPLFVLSEADTNHLVLASDNAAGTVILDASRSWDAENDPLQYWWWELDPTNVIASGVRSTNLMAVGEHAVTLRVSDGQDYGTTELTFEVVRPSHAAAILCLLIQEGDIAPRNKQPLCASLEAAMAALDRGSFTAGVNILQAFTHKVQAQVMPVNPALAQNLVRLARQIISTVQPP